MLAKTRESGHRIRKQAYDPSVLRVISDLITDAFENAMLDGILKRKDMMYWFEEIGRSCNIPDLIPYDEKERKEREELKRWARVQWQKQLAEEIKARLGSNLPVQLPEEATASKPKRIQRKGFKSY